MKKKWNLEKKAKFIEAINEEEKVKIIYTIKRYFEISYEKDYIAELFTEIYNPRDSYKKNLNNFKYLFNFFKKTNNISIIEILGTIYLYQKNKLHFPKKWFLYFKEYSKSGCSGLKALWINQKELSKQDPFYWNNIFHNNNEEKIILPEISINQWLVDLIWIKDEFLDRDKLKLELINLQQYIVLINHFEQKKANELSSIYNLVILWLTNVLVLGLLITTISTIFTSNNDKNILNIISWIGMVIFVIIWIATTIYAVKYSLKYRKKIIKTLNVFKNEEEYNEK